MINSFENYLKQGRAKRKTPDSEEAKALFENSIERLRYVNSKNIKESNPRFVLEDSYEAAREAAQSLMSLKGFKPYSHEATISFIREFYKQVFGEEDINKFDHFREVRNNSVYHAVKVPPEEAALCLSFASKFIEKIRGLLKV